MAAASCESDTAAPAPIPGSGASPRTSIISLAADCAYLAFLTLSVSPGPSIPDAPFIVR